MSGSACSYRHGPTKKRRIKSETIGNFDYAVRAAKVLENVFGKVCEFGLCRPNTESLSLPFTNVPVTVVEVRRRAGPSYPGRTTKDQRQTIPNRSFAARPAGGLTAPDRRAKAYRNLSSRCLKNHDDGWFRPPLAAHGARFCGCPRRPKGMILASHNPESGKTLD